MEAHGAPPGPSGPTYRRHKDLTPGGVQAFDRIMKRVAKSLIDELERQVSDREPGDEDPELTQEHVDKAWQAVLARDQQDAIARLASRRGRRRARRWALLSKTLFTIGSLGTALMINYLHSAIQEVVFGTLVIIGLAGLAAMWVGEGRGGEPPRLDGPGL